MPLSKDELNAIGTLVREAIKDAFEERLRPFRRDVSDRFEGLYAANEKRENEYFVLNAQMKRLEDALGSQREQLSRIEEKVDGHEARIETLEKEVA